jgi:hypothetical protein
MEFFRDMGLLIVDCGIVDCQKRSTEKRSTQRAQRFTGESKGFYFGHRNSVFSQNGKIKNQQFF